MAEPAGFISAPGIARLLQFLHFSASGPDLTPGRQNVRPGPDTTRRSDVRVEPYIASGPNQSCVVLYSKETHHLTFFFFVRSGMPAALSYHTL